MGTNYYLTPKGFDNISEINKITLRLLNEIRDNYCKWSFTFSENVALVQNIGNDSRFLYFNKSDKTFKTSATKNLGNSNYPHSINVYRLYAYPNISFSSSSVTINSDEEDGLVPTFVNPEGVDGITFKSSYNEVASINSEGVITLGGSSGTAVITATYPGRADQGVSGRSKECERI